MLNSALDVRRGTGQSKVAWTCAESGHQLAKVALATDIDKIQNLYQEYSQLPRSVINVSVVYSIKKCEGEVPAYSYFDTVLKDWINKGIVTFDQAQTEVIRRENNMSKKRGTKDPNWLKEYVKNFEEGVEDL